MPETWDDPNLKRLRERWTQITRGRNQSDYALAKLLTEIKGALPDGEFVRFCIDQRAGLGVGQQTGLMYERMVEAVAVIDAEQVWQAVGWAGVRKVVRVEQRRERVAVCRTILKERNQVGQAMLDEILAAHAPSYEPPKKAPVSKPEAIDRFEVLKETLTTLVAKYPILKTDLSPEVMAILGIEGGQRARTREAAASN